MIKFSNPDISKNDLIQINKSISSGWLTHGKYTTEFENYFANYVNSKYAVTVSSCTAGLHLSYLALGIGMGDEVILPAMSHTATAHAIEYVGAKCVFADIDYSTGNISVEQIKKKITKKTKAICIVHMSGISCNINEIKSIIKKNKLKLIEDCAHALGTYYNSNHVGNFGISGCFSFYPTKQITTGEGGMVVSNNLQFIKKIKYLKAFGIDTDPKNRKTQGKYDVKKLGFNYRMTDFQALMGLLQLKRYKKNLLKRVNNAELYWQLLKNNRNITLNNFSKKNSYFIFQIFIKNLKLRNKLLKVLKNNKIGVSVHYFNPIPKFTYYKKKYNIKNADYESSIKYANTSISLPCYPNLKKKEISFICKTINKMMKDIK